MSLVGQRIVKTICSNYCFYDERYTDEDSHVVCIPVSLFNTIIKKKNNSNPIFVKIVNPRDKTKFLHFGRVEPSINTENCRHDMCLLPYWVMQKLGIEDIVNIFSIDYSMVYHAKSIKIKADKSDYVKWDNVKELIEEKLSSFNCINVGDIIVIRDVNFTITEIKSDLDEQLTYTSTFDDEINLDFELPEDLEREQITPIEERVLQKARCEEKEEVKSVFSSEGIKLSETQDVKLTKEEIRMQRLNALNKK